MGTTKTMFHSKRQLGIAVALLLFLGGPCEGVGFRGRKRSKASASSTSESFHRTSHKYIFTKGTRKKGVRKKGTVPYDYFIKGGDSSSKSYHGAGYKQQFFYESPTKGQGQTSFIKGKSSKSSSTKASRKGMWKGKGYDHWKGIWKGMGKRGKGGPARAPTIFFPKRPYPKSPNPAPNPSVSVLDIVSSISSQTDVLTEGTPQNLAYNWLLTDDTLDPSNDQQTIINRYVLAVLYYATDGPNWEFCPDDVDPSTCPGPNNQFLSDSNVCEWAGVFCTRGQVTAVRLLDVGLGEGPVPSEMGSLLSLNELALEDGDLVGVPTELYPLTGLISLSFRANNIIGEIPPQTALLTELNELLLESNNLSGELPDFLNKLEKLEALTLGDNRFTGGIPESYDSLRDLRSLTVAANFLTGTLPSVLGKLTQLKSLAVFENFMSGTVPTDLGKLTDLEQLLLHFNDFTGTMPAEICALRASGQLEILTANCAGANPQVICDFPACCTLCF